MINLIRGFKDILPDETGLWQHVEAIAREIFESFGFAEIRTPIMENTELFARSIGANTDIVEKEMYTFADRNGSMLTLRPEATASVVRAYVEHKLYATDPVWRLYTIGPMFRRERPQKGRYRQFYQINAEVFGLQDPRADAELILLVMTFLERVKVAKAKLNINSLGCEQCRPVFRLALSSFLAGRAKDTEELCPDCLRRIDKNPLRAFDCKVAACKEIMKEAPSIHEYLCSDCKDHFIAVQEALNHFGVDYKINHRLVRGLDYYTRTTFEVIAEDLGAQDAVAGGGRYDGLVKALGGPDQPGLGFAIGFDRLTALIEDQSQLLEKRPFVFVAALGEAAQRKAFSWVNDLRLRNIRAEMDFEGRSLKSQMRRADKLGATHALIVGESELESSVAVLRSLRTNTQENVSLDRVIEIVADRLSRL